MSYRPKRPKPAKCAFSTEPTPVLYEKTTARETIERTKRDQAKVTSNTRKVSFLPKQSNKNRCRNEPSKQETPHTSHPKIIKRERNEERNKRTKGSKMSNHHLNLQIEKTRA
jgi:hypothetical protein